MTTEEEVMQEVKAAEEAVKAAEDVSEAVFDWIEETIFNGAGYLTDVQRENIRTNVIENCRDFSREWWSSNEAEFKAEEALRETVRKAEVALGKKIKSYYIG